MAPNHCRGTQPPQGIAGQGGSDGPPHPHARAHIMWVTDPNSPPSVQAVGGGGAPDTRRPSQQRQATPPADGPPQPPQHAAPTGHAGRGDGVGPPHPHARAHSTWVVNPNSPRSGRAVGGGVAPDNRRPSQHWKAPPRGRPSATPTASNAGPQGRMLWGRCWVPTPAPTAPGTHGSRNRRLHGRLGEAQLLTPEAPHNGGRPAPPDPSNGGRTARSQVGGNRDRTAPPKARQTEQGTGAGHAEGHGPRGTALPAPSAGTARGAHATPPKGGGKGRRGSASAHTRKGHAGTTRKATGPSSRNAQTAWNGVPASEGKGHPDEMARHTQRGTRGAGRGKRERHNNRYRPEPPEPAASAAHTQTGYCTRQGSSGALRHAPTPRLGSLRASPRGANWRQASSTGPVALAPRATGH